MMMVMGVITFYYMISSINSLITNDIMKGKSENKNLSTLFKIMTEYKLPTDLVKKAKASIFIKDKNKYNLKDFNNNFKKALRIELSYFIHYPILKNFSFMNCLRKNILTSVGKQLCRSTYPLGRSTFIINSLTDFP